MVVLHVPPSPAKLEEYMNHPNVNSLNQSVAKVRNMRTRSTNLIIRLKLVHDHLKDLSTITIKAEAVPPPFKSTKFYTLYANMKTQ